jgi:hypothetical protein
MAVFWSHRLLWLRVLCKRSAVLLALCGASEGGELAAIYAARTDVHVGSISDGCSICFVLVSRRLLRPFAVEELALIAAGILSFSDTGLGTSTSSDSAVTGEQGVFGPSDSSAALIQSQAQPQMLVQTYCSVSIPADHSRCLNSQPCRQ